MEYVLTIERRERNPQYVELVHDPNEYMTYGREKPDTRTAIQREFFLERVLTVTLTQAEYEAVKKGVVRSWGGPEEG